MINKRNGEVKDVLISISLAIDNMGWMSENFTSDDLSELEAIENTINELKDKIHNG